MKTLIPLIVFAAICFGVGLIAAVLLLALKKKRAALKTAAVLFALPVVAALLVFARDEWRHRDMQARLAYVQELCAKNGGERIYRTVDNVEGVFQMKARNPDPEDQWRDQYGMVDPWGANADSDNLQDLVLDPLGNESRYVFVEQQPPFGSPPGPPFRRTRIVAAPSTSADGTADARGFRIEQRLVETIRSRYGFYFEDLSTTEMREQWISAGRLKIVEISTGELIAERIGYGLGNPRNKMSWSGGDICSSGSGSFLLSALRPVPRERWLELTKAPVEE